MTDADGGGVASGECDATLRCQRQTVHFTTSSAP